MDRVSAEFHKNVLIITKFVSPHDDFKKQFKEGMFDKPNTLGFIHVSYYLLNVHYKEHVKHKVQWPVICKQTENKYRNDVRECLLSIASENSDLNFPPIFASHLLLARGTKFLQIMWKFSLAVLRTYLKREYPTGPTVNKYDYRRTLCMNNPKQGPCQELTKTFLKNTTKHHENVVLNKRKERQVVEKGEKYFQRKKTKEKQELKAKILKLRDELKQIIITAPVNDSAREKLSNTDDNAIINMWTGYIDGTFTSLYDDLETLSEKYESLRSVNNIVSNVKGDLLILNPNNFDKVNIEPICTLLQPEMQVIAYNIYSKETLDLQNFFSTFVLLLQQFQTNYNGKRMINLGDELSKCQIQLQTINKDLKNAMNSYQCLHEQAMGFTVDEIKKCDELNESQRTVQSIPEFDKVLLMPSPSIQINSYDVSDRNNYQNHLKLTPIEGPHKELFSRHAFKDEKGINSVRKPLFVQRINFDDSTLFESSGDKQLSISQLKFNTPSKLKSTFKNVDKYSRIFSTRKAAGKRVNNSVMVMMSSTGNSMLPLMTKQHCISLMDSSNLSQEISQEPLLLNPQMNSTINTPKAEENEKASQKHSKRRSIGDLVERYKRIIQKNSGDSQKPHSPAKERLGEEMVT